MRKASQVSEWDLAVDGEQRASWESWMENLVLSHMVIILYIYPCRPFKHQRVQEYKKDFMDST